MVQFANIYHNHEQHWVVRYNFPLYSSYTKQDDKKNKKTRECVTGESVKCFIMYVKQVAGDATGITKNELQFSIFTVKGNMNIENCENMLVNTVP